MPSNLEKKINFFRRAVTGILGFLGLFFIYNSFLPIVASALLMGCAFLICFLELPALFPGRGLVYRCCSSILFLSLFIPLLIINHTPALHELFPIVFIIAFSNDTGGYVVGNLCGKHFFAPSISPKKTIEGFVGSFFTALFVLAWYVNVHITTIAPFCLLITMVATSGDLFESYLKRKAGIKDAGILVPGHGGLLDRFDSILPVGIFFYLFSDGIIQLLRL